jgi:hypothetical protein
MNLEPGAPKGTWPRIREILIRTCFAFWDYDRKIPQWQRELTAKKREVAKAERLANDRRREILATERRHAAALLVSTPPPIHEDEDGDEDEFRQSGREIPYHRDPLWWNCYTDEDELRQGVRSRVVGASGRLTSQKIQSVLSVMYRENSDFQKSGRVFEDFYEKLKVMHVKSQTNKKKVCLRFWKPGG